MFGTLGHNSYPVDDSSESETSGADCKTFDLKRYISQTEPYLALTFLTNHTILCLYRYLSNFSLWYTDDKAMWRTIDEMGMENITRAVS